MMCTEVPESEVVTIFLVVAAKHFANNHRIVLDVMQPLQYVSGSNIEQLFTIDSSLACITRLDGIYARISIRHAQYLDLYSIDRTLVPVCRRVRAKLCSKVRGAQYDGECYAKHERYFGKKLNLVCDSTGIPAHFVVRLARYDTTAVNVLACTFPFGAVLLGDCQSVSKPLRYHLDAHYGVTMIAFHRTNIQPNTPTEQRLLRMRNSLLVSHSRLLHRFVH